MNLTRRRPRPWWGAPLLAVLPLLLFSSCTGKPPPETDPPADVKGDPWFADVTKESNVQFMYDNGQDVVAMTFDGKPVLDEKTKQPVLDKEGKPIGHLSIIESLGGGAGLIDFDRDGLLDLFLPGGGTYTGANTRTLVGRPCKFYKNLGNFKFQDVTKEVGLDKIDFYTHGVAVADYNRDGWPDLLVTGFGRVALFRNDPVDPKDPSKGRKFTDVTKEAGLDDHSWSTSAGFADFDGDGWVDLYVDHYVSWHFGNTEAEDKKSHPECTYDGKTRDVCPPKNFDALPHAVYRNNGKAGNFTFTDVSKSAGLRVPRTEEEYKSLHKDYVVEALSGGRAAREAPGHFKEKVVKRLIGDRQKATDEEKKKAEAQAEKEWEALSKADRQKETEEAAEQLAADICQRLRDAEAVKEYGKALGVVIVDVNGDGKPDVWVACDTVDKLFYLNRSRPGHILFEEMALGAGVARDDNGTPNGSMGVDAVDYDGCLRASLWCVNYENEKHALYHNDCTADRAVFRYATQTTGIAAIGQSYVGWGTQFVDFDRGGLQHLFVSNGHAIRFPAGKAKRFQKPVLMQCLEDAHGRRRYIDITAKHGGPYCEQEHCGRGVAFGDLDNDGRVDMVLSHLMEPTAILKTIAGDKNHWVGFELERKDHRDPVGAKVILEVGGKKQTRFAKGGGSYLSANDPRHVFGLGRGEKFDTVTVIWPDLTEQTWDGLAVDRYWRLVEGQKDAEATKYAK